MKLILVFTYGYRMLSCLLHLTDNKVPLVSFDHFNPDILFLVGPPQLQKHVEFYVVSNYLHTNKFTLSA